MKIRCGTDILRVSRIGNIKNIDRFLKKVFTEQEISYIESKNKNIETITGMFCLKEAVSKALKTGIGKMSFVDVESVHDDGLVVKLNTAKFPKVIDIDASISHDGEYAVAMCVIMLED
ncbi:holo-ACP synthase [uncultured Finegoldia sp.]|uniref:holo-ACP synthase n=1 Tax=uncultured Finegoldia sp. TaxID=328009 RepID=UPI00260A9D82|nr:holo-ACP synthase [uncultured Finegoldia sp.]